uniref:Uncharacterized protein n=1 Tax=Anguilla anguilla TaxID=7936 RepID=A0A0E9XB78_ANGAN
MGGARSKERKRDHLSKWNEPTLTTA